MAGRAAFRRQDGQALIIVIITMVVLLGSVGLAVDVGRAYLAQRQLQQAVDAAALAAGQTLPDSALARTKAIEYSATGKNVHTSSMTAGPAKIVFKCLRTLESRNIPCQPDPAPDTPCAPTAANPKGCNAVQVTQSATLRTLFARLFIPRFSVTARSTVGMRGGKAAPLNIMLVLDRTGSMDESCGVAVRDPNNNVVVPADASRKIDCAKAGVRQLLKGLLPCNPNITGLCGSSPPLDQVGLIVFPPLNDKNATTHDTGGDPAHSNINLESSASCSGELTAQPLWYTPTRTFPDWFLQRSDVGYGTPGVNEIQTVRHSLRSGNITLRFDDATTGSIPWDADAATVQAALEGLATIGSGNVEVVKSKTGNNVTYTITFQGPLGARDVGLLIATPTSGVTVEETRRGAPAVSPDYIFAPLSNDFRTSEALGLNPSSRLVQAVTWASCQGGVTGDGFASETSQGYPGSRHFGLTSVSNTYYAGAVSAAQSALRAAALAHPGSTAQPVIILLSDGEANTGSTVPCAAAVSAAQAAAQAGTWVFSIAYKLRSTMLCKSSDGANEVPEIDAYTAMAKMARSSQTPGTPDLTKFYCPGTTDQLPGLECQPGDTLTQVFRSIGISLTAPRIYPDDIE